MIINETQPIEVIKYYETNYIVMGYQESDQKILDAVIGEILEARIELCTGRLQKGDIVGHFPKGKTGNLPK